MFVFLFKLMIWLVMYPVGLFGFLVQAIVDIVLFVFNSPVDIWKIISNAVDGVEEEEPAKE